MGKITVIYENGETVSSPCSSLPLHKLQEMVGGPIQPVPKFYKYEREKCVAYCNEEGKLNGNKLNLQATHLWYDQFPPIVGIDALLGAVVIVQGADLLGKL